MPVIYRAFCFYRFGVNNHHTNWQSNCEGNPNHANMPSLVYIARIKNLPEELAKCLRSAGCHVKSFKPGDITQDECLLAMTAEAVGAGLHLQEGNAAQVGGAFAPTPAAADMNEYLGSQAAIWSYIKTAVSEESQAKSEPSAEFTEKPEGIELGFPHPEAGRPASTAQSQVSGEIARNVVSQVIGVSSLEALHRSRNIRPTKEEFYRVFRNPLSTVIVLLLFSVIYRGLRLPSTKGATIPREAYSVRSAPDSNSLLNVSASRGRTAHRPIPPLTLPLAESPPRAVDRVQQHLSHDNSVAKDFTNHFALYTQGNVLQQKPELKPPQSGSIRKRIVVD